MADKTTRNFGQPVRYGEAYFYTSTGSSTTSVAIDTTLLYHALALATTAGSCKGFTHLAGQANAIASVAENSAGVSMKITTTGSHNLSAGQCVTHTGFTTKTAYRGKYVVQSTPSATEYVVLGTYTGTDTGFMKRAFSLRADAGSTGIYNVRYTISAESASNTTQLKCEVNKNIADVDNIACQRYFATASQAGNFTSGGLMSITDGDYLWLSIANLTDASDFSIYHANLSIIRAN